MTGRFKISNHKGTSLKHRSGYFLNDQITSRSVPSYKGEGDTIKKIKSSQTVDKLLRPVTVVISIVMLLLLFKLIFAITVADYPISGNEERLKREKAKQEENLEMVLSSGYFELQRGNLSAAQREFQHYLRFYPEEIKGALGLTMTLVERCELDERYCKSATQYIEFTKRVNKGGSGLMYNATITELDNRLIALVD